MRHLLFLDLLSIINAFAFSFYLSIAAFFIFIAFFVHFMYYIIILQYSNQTFSTIS